ncbi:MAG: enolase, enolase [Microgenomates group bacterium GW2011_GWC1_41_8]|uniref:Enolase n=2 Tax=Candidatus Roizmaniibacteriota TaxID=1752723 RepID=A0A0G0W7A5_9BACT|nr:MAG: Enolase [Candidatus Levybacteria bacterium GW2011_GWA2_40_16]KKR71092.1 MAG: Enolase [Candidatus Roizmanbacteria bacterium GW2011_GWB1_40_7]KKR91819.1 MAG: Enolase [Candidatus Roizmanbacteria bacterium GW2011_GWA1_41_13]KKS24632.1 MAG: enolase, enolase [Microgenomates group bacterium GW2011_GWC1_41_8]OGK50442.1 MAG: phosphopyruvate hydratase [Candidatus Roizmanbacteria bacterium RIFCSPLOWO2_01_FULL_40_14]
MALISSITSREILDSRANPTIETSILLDSGVAVSSSVPSGAAIGKYEVIELRDNNKDRYMGLGVTKAVAYINKVIGPGLVGVDPSRQVEIDEWLAKVDGTDQMERFGGNTILSISQGLARAAAYSLQMSLYQYINSLYAQLGSQVSITRVPAPIFNVINGGKHGAGNLDFQEFHIIPASSKPYPASLQMGVELYHRVRKVLIDKNAIHSVGDEGGYAPNLYTNLDAFEIIMQAVRNTPYQFGEDVFIGLDVASDHFYKKDHYKIRDKQQAMRTDDFIAYLVDLNNQYHLLMLEDPLYGDDWNGWKKLTTQLGEDVIIVGDDLIATNLERLKKAHQEQACTGVLVKPNQAGTLTETLKVIQFAQKNNFKVTVSHRSGETVDDFIADLAVGVQCDYVKFGAPARGERVTKYNRLLSIAADLTHEETSSTSHS